MLFDGVVLVVTLAIAFLLSAFGSRRWRWLTAWMRPVARRRWLAITVVSGVALLISLTLGLLVHLPVPAVHDEFGYLLGSDTFGHGRLTNPTHPMWEHFETYHVIHRPTYQMKFPPGQSFALALGAWCGHPIIGVWLSLALACGAVCWMLQGWLPARWAFFGSLLPVANFGLLKWWGQSYWGGAVTMLGGALLFGAVPRLLRQPRGCHAVVLALGLAILANTRPYEGVLAAIPVGVIMVVWAFGSRGPSPGMLVRRVVLPAAIVLAAAGGWMGYYNYRVTGTPWVLPYQVWQQTYGHSQSLTTVLVADSSQPQTAARSSPTIRTQSPQLTAEQKPYAIQSSFWMKVVRQWLFYPRVLLAVPLVAFLLARRVRGLLLLLVATTMVVVGVGLQKTSGNPHYVAPVAGCIYLLLAQGFRYMRVWQPQALPVGATFVRLFPLALLLSLVNGIVGHVREPVAPFQAWSLTRAQILGQLESDGARHLVVVRYQPTHHVYREWVYNGADIDAARVVWAQELAPDKNRQLLDYFRDRHVWLLEADARPVRLVPHPRERPTGTKEGTGSKTVVGSEP